MGNGWNGRWRTTLGHGGAPPMAVTLAVNRSHAGRASGWPARIHHHDSRREPQRQRRNAHEFKYVQALKKITRHRQTRRWNMPSSARAWRRPSSSRTTKQKWGVEAEF